MLRPRDTLISICTSAQPLTNPGLVVSASPLLDTGQLCKHLRGIILSGLIGRGRWLPMAGWWSSSSCHAMRYLLFRPPLNSFSSSSHSLTHSLHSTPPTHSLPRTRFLLLLTKVTPRYHPRTRPRAHTRAHSFRHWLALRLRRLVNWIMHKSRLRPLVSRGNSQHTPLYLLYC